MKQLKMTQDILLYALKYALPRVSNAPSEVAGNIIRSINVIENYYLQRFIDEIKKKDYPKDTATLWESLLEDIKLEIATRERLK